MFHVKHLRLIIKVPQSGGTSCAHYRLICFEWQESDKVAHIHEEQSEYVNKDCSERTGKERSEYVSKECSEHSAKSDQYVPVKCGQSTPPTGDWVHRQMVLRTL